MTSVADLAFKEERAPIHWVRAPTGTIFEFPVSQRA